MVTIRISPMSCRLFAGLTLSTGYAGAETTFFDPVLWAGNGHSYQVVTVSGGISWDAARDQSSALGGYLVSIHSAAENEFVKSLIRGHEGLWSAGGYRGCWLGGYQPAGSAEPVGGWSWVSGEEWTYSAWGAGEPNNAAGYEHVLEIMDFSGGFGNSANVGWNDMNATGGLWGPMKTFVVEYPVIPAPASAVVMLTIAVGRYRRRRDP